MREFERPKHKAEISQEGQHIAVMAGFFDLDDGDVVRPKAPREILTIPARGQQNNAIGSRDRADQSMRQPERKSRDAAGIGSIESCQINAELHATAPVFKLSINQEILIVKKSPNDAGQNDCASS